MDFIEIYSDALSKNNCNILINHFENSSSKNPGYIFNGEKNVINKSIKDSTDLTLFFSDQSDISSIIFNCLNKHFYFYLQKYKDLYSLNELCPKNAFNIQRYYQGQGYSAIHCEHNSKDSTNVLGWMIYLNSVEDGGTEFTNYKKVIECKVGNLVIWPAYWTHSHRGIISKTKTKYICTGWIEFL